MYGFTDSDEDRDSGLNLTGDLSGNYQSLMDSGANKYAYGMDEDSGNFSQIRSDFGAGMGDNAELDHLFGLISSFQPEPVDIQVHWKPFIPTLVPSIGAIDAFIKVPRPDGELDDLGLVILDEPSISQSNPQILRMELREQYGISSPANESDGYAGFIEDAPKNQKALTAWLDAIEEIHRTRPPGSFIYTSKMPEMEDLMDVWPKAFEDALNAVGLPSAEMDVSFDELAKIMLSILEIPVRGNIIESLHCLFSLFAEFENNPAFKKPETPSRPS